MGNRKQPFGYHIRNGKITVNAVEAEIVKRIYADYLNGASFNEITNELKKQSVVYDENKLWNKNMIARILGDRRYVGNDAYPQIVSEADFTTATAIRNGKFIPDTRTEAQKLLRKLCDQKPEKLVEQQVLCILNKLVESPDLIQPQAENASADTTDLQNGLEVLLTVQPLDEKRAKELIFSIATTQYNAIGNSEYESERLRRMFTKTDTMQALDANVLRSSVSEVLVTQLNIELRLKNGQIIGMEDVK